MSDFIREVDEDYRRERAINFLRRFWVPLVIAGLLIIVGAGGWRWYVDRQDAQAAGADARFQDAETQAQEGRPAEAAAGFRALAAGGPAGYALLARLRGAEVLGTTDPEAGAKELDAIASDEGAGTPALRDLARYRGALLRLGRDDPKAFEARYGRFALDAFAFHDGMRELLALAALARDDRPAASKYLEDIAIDPLAPPGLRNRAQAFRELVNAGPATSTTAAPGAAAVTPVGGAAAPVEAPLVETLPPQFEPIAPVSRMPQSALPPSGEPETPGPDAAPVAPAVPPPAAFPPAAQPVPPAAALGAPPPDPAR